MTDFEKTVAQPKDHLLGQIYKLFLQFYTEEEKVKKLNGYTVSTKKYHFKAAKTYGQRALNVQPVSH